MKQNIRKTIWEYNKRTKKFKKLDVDEFVSTVNGTRASPNTYYRLEYLLTGFCNTYKNKLFALHKSTIKPYLK